MATAPATGRQAKRRSPTLPSALSWSPAAATAAGLAAATTYPAFASGAIGLPDEARLQVGLAAIALFSLAGLLFAPHMRLGSTRAGWAGLAVLAAFAAWTGASLAWSVTPDATWAELNRVIAYTLAVALGMVVGASLPRALERAALGFLVVATVVALYAIGGKVAPGVHVGPVDLNHTAFFSRLRAPLAYWNALALFCVLAVPVAVRAAADPRRGRLARAAALSALVVLLVTTALTYSRGGFAALAVVLLVLIAVGPDRLRTITTAAAGVLGAAPALVVGFASNDLTTDLVPVAQRAREGAILGAALIAGCVVAFVVARFLDRLTERTAPEPIPPQRLRLIAAVAAAAVVVLTLAGLAASNRGISGTVSHSLDSFTSVKYERQNDPARILQTNSGNRWVWWSEAVGAFSDRPLEGWGAGSFPLLHHHYRHNALEVLQPHSVPLQFLAELGLIGTLLAAAALALLTTAAAGRIVAGMRAERAGITPGREQRYAVALLAAVAAWLVHMWFDWDWDMPGVALPFFAALGLLAARPLGMPGPSLAPPRGGPLVARRLAALTVGAALLCAVGISAALPSLAHDHAELATSAVARGDLAEAARQADIARRLNPTAVDALLLEARVAGRRGQLQFAARLLTQAVRRQPDNPDVWYAVARLELARGDVPAMRAAARKMLDIDRVGSTGGFFFLYNDVSPRSATATGTPLPLQAAPPAKSN